MSLSFISSVLLRMKVSEFTFHYSQTSVFILICGGSKSGQKFLKNFLKIFCALISSPPKKDRASQSKLCLNLYSIHSIFQSFNLSIFQSFNPFNPYSPIIFLNCPSSIPSIIVLTNSPKSLCPLSPVNLISPCHFPITSPTLTLPPLQAFLTSCLFHS